MLEIDILPASKETKGADAILLRFGEFNYTGRPNNQTIVLIDGGYADASKLIINHIKNVYNSYKIDCVICTHPDADHIDGLIELLKTDNLTIDNLCVHNPWKHAYAVSRKIKDNRSTTNSVRNRLDDGLSALDDLLALADENKIKTHEPFAGFKIYDIITVLGPSENYYCELLPQYPGMHEERTLCSDGDVVEVEYNKNNGHFHESPITTAKNDSSMVLYLNYNGYSVLFSGDAGVEGLSKAINYAKGNNIAIAGPNFFQIPHHGSIKNINPAILSEISPKAAFVSAPPKSNKHPSRHIMNFLSVHKGIKVYHVSTNSIRLNYGAPQRPGWDSPATALPVFQTVFVPR